LATVIDLDAAESARTVRSALSAEAQGVLEDPAGYVVDFDPDTVVLTGEPAHALLEYAQDKEADLLAVGTHGRGLSKAVLGSVAQRLVRQGDIPVLVVGTGMPVPRRLQHGAETHHSVRT
jgi:nucleotide-binding universal stress UspA family protein